MAREGSKRGRGRGRGRGAQKSRQMQDYLYTPPPLIRRSSRGVVPQLLALPPSGSTTRKRPLKSAQRCLRGDRETAVAVLPSQPAGDYPVYENGSEDVKPSIPTGSPSVAAPCNEHEMDSDALCTKITSKVDGYQQQAVQPPSHHNVEGNTQPPGENSEAPHDEHAPVKITATADHAPSCLSHSHNMTGFARRLKHEPDDDHEEVVSAPGVDYEYINGRKVKIEIAHLVRAIIGKYGDITSDCKVKSLPLFSFLLERMCYTYKTLEKKNLFALTHDEVNIMRDELQLCEHHKLNVGWLLERLQQISETMSSSREYLMLKEEAQRCMQSKESIKMQVELQRRHIDLILKKISMSEKQMAENEAKANKCMQKASDIKAKVKPLFNQSLVHGLL